MNERDAIYRQPRMRSETQRDIPITESSGTCQWPAWDIDDSTGCVCGDQLAVLRYERTRRGVTPVTGAYCSYHQQKAYPTWKQPEPPKR